MPKTVWKYPLEITDEQTVKVPRGAIIRHVGVQDGKLCIWAEVDPSRELEPIEVLVVGTGNRIPDHALRFYGTVVMSPFVWHVYAA